MKEDKSYLFIQRIIMNRHLSRNVFFLLFSFTLLISLPAYSQSDNFPLGTRAAAMGNAYSAESDIWSVHHNQAGLGFYPYPAIGFHHENKFLVPEYNLHALAITYPVKTGTFGLSWSYFGYSVYNESKAGLAYGMQFGNGFSAGVQLNLHHNYLEGEFGQRNALSVEGGIQYKPGENLTIGVHIFNPTRARITYQQDTIPTIFRTGISFIPIEGLTALFQLEKYLNYELALQGGLEYHLLENLYIRGGFMSRPTLKGTFGIGYEIKKISADIAFTKHQILGFTPHFSMQVKLR